MLCKRITDRIICDASDDLLTDEDGGTKWWCNLNYHEICFKGKKVYRLVFKASWQRFPSSFYLICNFYHIHLLRIKPYWDSPFWTRYQLLTLEPLLSFFFAMEPIIWLSRKSILKELYTKRAESKENCQQQFVKNYSRLIWINFSDFLKACCLFSCLNYTEKAYIQ